MTRGVVPAAVLPAVVLLGALLAPFAVPATPAAVAPADPAAVVAAAAPLAPAELAVAHPAPPNAAFRPRVLLVAVGDEQPVFDRFVADLAQRLEAIDTAGVTVASSSGKVGRRLDTPADLLAAVRGLRPPSGSGGDGAGGSPAGRADSDSAAGRPGVGTGSGCLVYLTGHGTRAGLAMPLAASRTPPAAPGRRYAPIRPRDLDVALRDGCGDAPTVVVASACYSGVYLGRGGLRGAGRVVLTAARADRPSFGCGDDQTYTYHDGCFLEAFDTAPATWRGLVDRVQACVARRERELQADERPSQPQAWFGAAVRELPLPAAR